MSDYLPADLLDEVLLRTSAKCLVKCTAVCKSWYSLITSSDFIDKHSAFTRESKRSAPLLLLRTYLRSDAKEHYRLVSDDDELDTIGVVEFPFRTKSGLYFRIVGCMNGMYLLHDDLFSLTTTMILWNPAVKRYVRVPKPIMSVGRSEAGVNLVSLGYGYDCVNDDYKIVRLVYTQLNRFGLGENPPAVEMYSLRSKSWRMIAAHGFGGLKFQMFGAQLFTMGAIHWIVVDPEVVILCFDVNSEVFRKIELPEGIAHKEPGTKGLRDFNGSLAIYNYYFLMSGLKLQIWVMREYGVVHSWAEHYIFDLAVGLGKGIGLPLGFRKDGKMFFRAKIPYDIISTAHEVAFLLTYDPKAEEVREFQFPGLGYSLEITGYMDNILLLDKVHNAVSYHEGVTYGKGNTEDSEDPNFVDEIEGCILGTFEEIWRTGDSKDPNFVDEIDGHIRGSFDEIWAAYALDPYGVFQDLS